MSFVALYVKNKANGVKIMEDIHIPNATGIVSSSAIFLPNVFMK